VVLSATAFSAEVAGAQPPLLYVCNQEAASVSVVDTGTRSVVRTIDLTALGFGANARPHHIAFEADGSFWYLSLIGANRVLKFDRDDRLVGQVEFETPGMLAVDPRSDLVWVGRSMTAVNPPPRIGAIRRADMGIEEVDVVFPRPHALSLDPGGAFVYTASMGANRIMIVDRETLDVSFTEVPEPHHVLAHSAISPDGSRLILTGEHSGKLLAFDASRAPELAPLATLDVQPMPWLAVFSPDGRFAYFGNQATNTVTVVDAGSWTVTAIIAGEGLSEPYGLEISPDGRYLYLVNRNLRGAWSPPHASSPPGAVGNVAIIDTRSRTIASVIPVGRGPTGIALRPR
jgi:YVTN family beta-propeller protein